MTLRDMMRRDGATLTSLEHFGEAVLYRPVGAAPRTINVVLHRFGLGRNEDDGETANDVAEALVRNDPVLGSAGPQPGDLYEFPLEEGGTPAIPWRFVECMDHDAAFWRCRLEAEE